MDFLSLRANNVALARPLVFGPTRQLGGAYLVGTGTLSAGRRGGEEEGGKTASYSATRKTNPVYG